MKYKLPLLISILFMSYTTLAQNITTHTSLPLAKYDDNVSLPLTEKEKAQIDEVYGDYAEKYVYSNPQRLKEIKQILRNRVIIEYHKEKDFSTLKKLSEIPLVNSNNKSLKRDIVFDSNSFNPLKYAFNFFSRDNLKYYSVDNTQYLIKILPQH